MKTTLFALLTLFIGNAFSQAPDSDIFFHSSEPIKLRNREFAQFSDEFPLDNGGALAVHRVEKLVYDVYQFDAEMKQMRMVTVDMRKFIEEKEAYYSDAFFKLGDRIYFRYMLNKGDVYEIYAAPLSWETLEPEAFIELDTRGKYCKKIMLSSDGLRAALCSVTDEEGEGKESIEIDVLYIDQHLKEISYNEYGNIQTKENLADMVLSNTGILYRNSKSYSDEKPAVKEDPKFRYEVFAFDLNTSEAATYKIDLSGFFVSEWGNCHLSVSKEGNLDVWFPCNKHGRKAHDALAVIRIDPTKKTYALGDYFIEVPPNVVNAEKVPAQFIDENNPLKLEIISERLFYLEDGTACMLAAERHEGSPARSTNNSDFYNYSAIYLLWFDNDGRFETVTVMPISQFTNDIQATLLEKEGKLRLLYFDLEENLTVNSSAELKKYRENPALAKSDGGKGSLVNVTIRDRKVVNKEALLLLTDLPFGIWLKNTPDYLLPHYPEASHKVVETKQCTKIGVISGKQVETAPCVVYSYGLR
jgi:hypothetical protein